jgi:hypothetical protein
MSRLRAVTYQDVLEAKAQAARAFARGFVKALLPSGVGAGLYAGRFHRAVAYNPAVAAQAFGRLVERE